MYKLISFNLAVALACAGYWNFSQRGELGLDWSFLKAEIVQSKNLLAK